MKKIKDVVFFVVFLMSAVIYAQASNFSLPGHQDPTCAIPKLNPDKVPFPGLKNANTRFELADGETYVLKGKVQRRASRYYFEIDLGLQPWLATSKMIADNTIQIDARTIDLVRGVSSRDIVQIAVVMRSKGSVLQLIAEPVAYDPAQDASTN